MTLGFRGEALAAITAVSEFRILTKRREDAEGTELAGAYGKVESVTSAGCPDGTTIICEKFFASTPARLKFLKSESSEGAAVISAVEKLAVSRPDIAFRMISDGALKFSTSGDGNLKNAIYSVYGSAFAKNLVSVQGKTGGISVRGFTSAPDALRGNRAMQLFFINDRSVRGKTLTAALEAAYRSYAPTGKFPFCVLNLEISASLVDVNIHPAKLEVKFSDEKSVFDALYAAVRNALAVGIARPKLDLAEIAEKTEKRDVLENLFSEAREKGEKTEVKPSEKPLVIPEVTPPSAKQTVEKETPVIKERKPFVFDDDDLPVDIPPAAKPISNRFGAEISTEGFGFMNRLYASAIQKAEPFPMKEEAKVTHSVENTDAKIPKMQTHSIPEYRIAGEVFASYIIVETDEKMILVDKHAAHERIHFERLRANMNAEKPQTQMLLFAEVLPVSAEEAAVCEDYRAELSACGFEYTVSDRKAELLGIPLGLEKQEAKTLFQTLLTETASGGETIESARRNAFEKALYQSACKASVKAGRVYDEAHLRWICDNLFRYDCIKFCPHGRPVAFELSKKELDTRFGRT